jgi:hypothetical protein
MAFVLQTFKQGFRKKYLQLFYRNNHTGGGGRDSATAVKTDLAKKNISWARRDE